MLYIDLTQVSSVLRLSLEPSPKQPAPPPHPSFAPEFAAGCSLKERLRDCLSRKIQMAQRAAHPFQPITLREYSQISLPVKVPRK